ncbi:hypothetical protein [Mycobacteroides abscessus]|uniref:hypothetical protein n=1 Tax=Mycobacteroides abscessus TaxID=36809 RepID=UPI00092B9234|nr:hypothetical protein [Mycobacteroides abscessus]SIH60258.1 Uncharacterised protein [Mycobacteroides abscessus subsp. abscessus]SIN52456.1 Uncharacterised protein [Mycobacteroides abscessus subsp. abscessus]SLI56873.1 Uncharacterised protein [Mycobacteroides abscessus subsp. abscessus]
MEILGGVGHALTDLWSNHSTAVTFGFTVFTLLLTQYQAWSNRRKTAADAKAKAVADEKVQELDRSNKLVGALRDIAAAKDPILLNQAVILGRKLANKPAPVKYRPNMSGPFDLDNPQPDVPEIDEKEERFRVELAYYRNPHAEIPDSPRAGYYSTGFPNDIPKEWLPSLVKAILETLPARFPSYYDIANADRYGKDNPIEVIRQVARLADAVEQHYLRVSKRPISEFIVATYADHWSKLSDVIHSLLVERGGEFPNLGCDFLHFVASHNLKVYSPHLVRLAVVQGVSEAIYDMRNDISHDQKRSLASAYATLVRFGTLSGLGRHRLWHHSLYCNVKSWDFEDEDGEFSTVGKMELAEDHDKGNISIDRTLALAVLAMGIVSPDSPPNPRGGPGHYTMRIVEYLPKAFESYRPDPQTKRRMQGHQNFMPWESKLDYDCVNDFVEGVYRLSKKRHYKPDVEALISSAEILVPDIAARIEQISDDDLQVDDELPEEPYV